MKNFLFKTGQPQSINAVLANKDQRAELQAKLINVYSNDTLIAVKLNIPGPIKNNQYIKDMFDTGLEFFLADNNFEIIQQMKRDAPTGPEAILVVSQAGAEVKKQAVKFEDNYDLGRLFDIDVLTKEHGHWSRTELGEPVRKCLICDYPAKECARSRKHSVAELQQKIEELYLNGHQKTQN